MMAGFLNNDRTSIVMRENEKRVEGLSSEYIDEAEGQVNFRSVLPVVPVSNHTSTERASKEDSENRDGVIRVPSGSGYRMMKPFPWLLHEMLEDVEKQKLGWIVSWMPDGNSFQVHSAERFADTILPTYFRHKRYKSFQRQLYLYGFRSLQDNSIVKGKYVHPLFMRDYRTLCAKIVRPKCISTTPSKPKSRSSRASKDSSRKERMDTPNDSKPNITYRPQDSITDDGSTSPCAELNQQFILSGSVEPLSYTRSITTFNNEAAVSNTPIDSYQQIQYQLPILTGQFSHRTLKQPSSNSLLKNMQRAMLVVPESGSSLCSPDFCGGDVGPFPSLRTEDDFESYSKTPDGPIYSISLGNSKSMDYQSCPTGSGDFRIIADPVSSWNYGTASIRQLEPYSDSIIKLFGSSSALFAE